MASLASALRNQRRSAWAADMSEGTNCILLAFSTLVGKCHRLLSRDRLVHCCIPSTQCNPWYIAALQHMFVECVKR